MLNDLQDTKEQNDKLIKEQDYYIYEVKQAITCFFFSILKIVEE
jgi:hypothetical protein